MNSDLFKPLQLVAKNIEKALKPAVDCIRKFAETMNESLKPIVYFASFWKKIYYIEQPKQQEYLDVGLDPYGYFIIGGKRTKHYHSRTSEYGKFLNRLLKSRAVIVPYSEINRVLNVSSDRKKVFKDLRRYLRHDGYILEYELVRTEGIALLGIRAI